MSGKSIFSASYLHIIICIRTRVSAHFFEVHEKAEKQERGGQLSSARSAIPHLALLHYLIPQGIIKVSFFCILLGSLTHLEGSTY